MRDQEGRDYSVEYGRQRWANLPNPDAPTNPSYNPLLFSNEVVLIPGVVDAVAEGGRRPGPNAMERTSPYNDVLTDPVQHDTEKPPCDEPRENMSLGEVYGEDVAVDSMTGGIRGASLQHVLGQSVAQLPVPPQEEITDKCDPHWFEKLTAHCAECAKNFSKAGGCDAMAREDTDVVHEMIPMGCWHCEDAARHLCFGADEIKCPRLRLRGVPALQPEKVPEYLMYPVPEEPPWDGPRSDRVLCPPPKIRHEEQIRPGPD